MMSPVYVRKRVRELLDNTVKYKQRKEQMISYVIDGQTSASFERKVQFRIPDSDNRKTNKK